MEEKKVNIERGEAQEPFFRGNEAREVIAMSRELVDLHRGIITADDVHDVHVIMRRAVEGGYLRRDRYGINPVHRHLDTALTLARSIAPDRDMLLATLLYNLCKKGAVEYDALRRRFGNDVAHLVHGLLAVGDLYKKQAAVQDENFHKLLITFAEDIRVILIMIADRLALMRRINHHPDEELVRNISTEARYLYAPLAHRLGLYQVKGDLEDMSLKYLNRKVYSQIAEKLSETKVARDKYVKDFIQPVHDALVAAGLKFEIKGRTKSINSIWNKMTKQQVDLDGIYDLFAIRIILDSAPEREKADCWMAYSVVTDIYTANTRRLRDWITIPKSNGYESLHITVNGPDNKWVEVQIRTRRMDDVAERGLAAHWKYKGIKSEGDLDVWMNNVREILETGSEGQMQLIRSMSTNVYEKEVFVFTPKGDLFKLPSGATVLDFAFHIHSSLGCRCMGARIDGKNQKINYRLRSGDTVEILTGATQVPRADWLNIVVTSKARNKIRQAINEAASRKVNIARELLQRRFRNRKINLDEATLARLIKRMGYKTNTDFFLAIDAGTLDVNTVIEQYDAQVQRQNEPVEPTTRQSGSAEDFVLHTPASPDGSTPATDAPAASGDVLVIGTGVKGINYKLSKCCNPIYGDKVIGFIASDGAVKVHRADCANVRHIAERYPYRIIRCDWSGKIGTQFAATLRVVGRDDIGIVASITSVINKNSDTMLHGISIQSKDGSFEGVLTISIGSLASLDTLIKKIQGVKGVKHVDRL